MTVRGPGAVQRLDATDVAQPWRVLTLAGAAATYANTTQTVSSTDSGGGYMTLTATGDGSAPGDYLSRMQSIVWDLPPEVAAVGLGGWDVLFHARFDTVPADGSGYTFYMGLTDGDPGTGTTVALAAGIRYVTVNPRLVASRRGGGGADVESGPVTTPADPKQLIVTVDASTIALNQVGVHCLDAAGTTNGNEVITRGDTSTYTGPLRLIIAWGIDGTGAATAHSLRVRPSILLRRVPLP